MEKSPLAPDNFPALTPIKGVTLATAAAGVKYKDRTDVMVAKLAPGSAVAGVFTRSSTRSAAVLDCQTKLGTACEHGGLIVVNSGNSNAFTGAKGQTSVDAICASASGVFDVPIGDIFTSSTGVIGEPLPHEKITDSFAAMAGKLDAHALEAAAAAIMTTDTFAKGSTVTLDSGVSISGIAKGSGMIAPDMATMLVYIFTDAKISQPELQKTVSTLNDQSFNCITVDSDTSTSDTLLVAATGASDVDVTNDPGFVDGLRTVMLDLAHQVVRDGEGATKFVEVQVTSATSTKDAGAVASAIANSPLVKTAIAGEDPNWGRIVMAVGKSGANADRDKLTIKFGDILVAENGWVAETYTEAAGSEYMKQQDLIIAVDLGLGTDSATMWTCDLTHGYITINADYRS